MKIIHFEQYCPICKYAERCMCEEPCFLCLQTPAREHSRKPVKFVKDENKKTHSPHEEWENIYAKPSINNVPMEKSVCPNNTNHVNDLLI